MIAIFPEIVACVANKDIERLVVLVRKYYAGKASTAPKLDFVNLVEAVGIRLEVGPLEDDAILCVKDERGMFQVVGFMNESIQARDERSFLLAHLLGHFFLHVQPHIAKGEWNTSGLREILSPAKRYSGELLQNTAEIQGEQMEQEADSFAAALIMPKAMLTKAYNKFKSVQKTADFFGVNERTAQRRLGQLGLVEDKPVSFGHAEHRLKNESLSKSSDLKGVTPASRDVLRSDRKSDTRASKPISNAYAKQSYAKNNEPATEAKSPASESPASDPSESKLTGLARIRELAKKIDQSVKVD